MQGEVARPNTLSSAQIGAAGVLLVQYQLLKNGIDSAPMTTDVGIDLVAYSPARTAPLTIQVKTNLAPKPAGGRGQPALDWWIPIKNPADLFALCDLSEERVWLFDRDELPRNAQQQTAEKYHVCISLSYSQRSRRTRSIQEFEPFLLVYRIQDIFTGKVTCAADR